MIFKKIYIVFVAFPVLSFVQSNFFTERDAVIKKSKRYATGATLPLNLKEMKANRILMRHKHMALNRGITNPEKFLAAQHFFHSKDFIENSCVYKILQQVPKGASLHSHSSAMVSHEYLFKNLTFRDNLFAQEDIKGNIKLKFFKKGPTILWKKVAYLRKIDPTFNKRLWEQTTLINDEPYKKYRDINTVWRDFQNLFDFIKPLVSFKLVFKDYFYQTLKELYEDNVRYMEFRTSVPDVYDLEGNILKNEEVINIYRDTINLFQNDFPDFLGAKLIFAAYRGVDLIGMQNYINKFKRLKYKYPDFIVGFDLVGQEDLGYPLSYFVPQLLELKEITHFFFHAGETNWFGQSTDLNLFDAILLNTSRIGHGFSITKHPELLKLIKERQIALEISPISNQVLGLVRDLRNHPANNLLTNGYPVVITNDDPTFWGSKGLSFDWYLTFMGMSSRDDDLRLLKQLAINSIIYSTMDSQEKYIALIKWQYDWHGFIDKLIKFNNNHC